MKIVRLSILILLLITLTTFAQNCAYQGGNPDFLSEIGCKKDFVLLKAKPLSEKYGNVSSIKIVYDILTKKIYYIHSRKYKFHYDFCSKYLNTYHQLAVFNSIEYGEGKSRKYIVANINHYEGQGIYTLEFFPDDKISIEGVKELFNKVKVTAFFGKNLNLLNNSSLMEAKIKATSGNIALPLISVDSLYKNQDYQPLKLAYSYGYLRKVPIEAFETTSFSPYDIIVTDGLPNEFPICQGIITTCFQTPLCHVNVLSGSRGTPNAAWKKAFLSPRIAKYEGKLVYYCVTQDSLIIHAADSLKAVTFWNEQRESKTPIVFKPNYNHKKLVDWRETSYKDINLIGGKAANFASLSKVTYPKGKTIDVPEGGFAIPFYFYQQHIERNNLKPLIEEVIHDPFLKTNRDSLAKKLEKLREAIKAAPIDPQFIKTVEEKIQKQHLPYNSWRFRSSTNAEDISGFNGAGLYDSKTGTIGSTQKPIKNAIRAVWASLWNLRAFEEREYYRINHASVAMGILVHRAFGEDGANGVVITQNLYREGYPSFTVNVQEGETSVVLPENDSITCDQFLIHFTYGVTNRNETIIEYISHSNLTHGKPVMSEAEIKTLAEYCGAVKKYFYNQTDWGTRVKSYDDFGLDIEFKLALKTRKIYLKQVRPFEK